AAVWPRSNFRPVPRARTATVALNYSPRAGSSQNVVEGDRVRRPLIVLVRRHVFADCLAGGLNLQRDGRRRHDRFSTAEWCRRNDRMGRLIRHASGRVTLAVCPLPVPMVQPAFRTALVAAVGSAALLTPGVRTADRAAIPLLAIAVRTNPEHRLASLTAANPLSENHFFLNRHPPRRWILT